MWGVALSAARFLSHSLPRWALLHGPDISFLLLTEGQPERQVLLFSPSWKLLLVVFDTGRGWQQGPYPEARGENGTTQKGHHSLEEQLDGHHYPPFPSSPLLQVPDSGGGGGGGREYLWGVGWGCCWGKQVMRMEGRQQKCSRSLPRLQGSPLGSFAEALPSSWAFHYYSW